LSSQPLSPLAQSFEPLVGAGAARLGQQVLENTPASRFASTANKALDERQPLWKKAANLLSGVKVSDVDVDQAKAWEMADAAKDVARTMPHLSRYESYYAKPEDQPLLTPDEVRILQVLNAQARDSRAHMKQVRAQAPRIGVFQL
jgi:hypothetical protein